MISHGIEISIAGGGADEKDEEIRGGGPLYMEGNPNTALCCPTHTPVRVTNPRNQGNHTICCNPYKGNPS